MINTKKLFVLLFLFSTTMVFGQNTILGKWTSQNFIIDLSKDTVNITDELEKVSLTFNTDSTYIKTFHSRNKFDSIPLIYLYKIVDNKLVRKSYDKDGYELKTVRVNEIIEKGRYSINSIQESITFTTDKRIYSHKFRLDDTDLIIADILDYQVIFMDFKKGKNKKVKNGSR